MIFADICLENVLNIHFKILIFIYIWARDMIKYPPKLFNAHKMLNIILKGTFILLLKWEF